VASLQDDSVGVATALSPVGAGHFKFYHTTFIVGLGLDVPHIRSFTVEAKNGEQKLYRPIESFGKIYMYADPWHTNAVGYQLIARALLDTLKKNEQAKDYLRQAK
jgi:hypothetical protein